MRNLVVRALLLLAPIAAGLYALYLGQDASWDLRNYHYYNPFAFLTGRMGHDIAVAHVATYYNPALHLPFYWAVNSLPPWAVGFLLALLAGLNVWPLYLIARQAIDLERSTLTVLLCGATALVGMLGAMNLAELGTSYGDNLLSLPVLVSIWLVLKFRERIAGGLRTWVACRGVRRPAERSGPWPQVAVRHLRGGTLRGFLRTTNAIPSARPDGVRLRDGGAGRCGLDEAATGF